MVVVFLHYCCYSSAADLQTMQNIPLYYMMTKKHHFNVHYLQITRLDQQRVFSNLLIARYIYL